MFLWCSIFLPMKNIFNFIDMLVEKIAWFIHFTFIWIIISRSLGWHDFRWDNGLFCLLYAYCFLLRQKWNAHRLNEKPRLKGVASFVKLLSSEGGRMKSTRMWGKSSFATILFAKSVYLECRAKFITVEEGSETGWTKWNISFRYVLSAIIRFTKIHIGHTGWGTWSVDEYGNLVQSEW